MTSIDPSSAIWGYGFGRIVSEKEKEEIKEIFRIKLSKICKSDRSNLKMASF